MKVKTIIVDEKAAIRFSDWNAAEVSAHFHTIL